MSGEAPARRPALYRSKRCAKASGSPLEALTKFNSGGGLFCRAVTHRVSSALEGLTTVFGMGTGGTPPHLATGKLLPWQARNAHLRCRYLTLRTASRSLPNREPPLPCHWHGGHPSRVHSLLRRTLLYGSRPCIWAFLSRPDSP